MLYLLEIDKMTSLTVLSQKKTLTQKTETIIVCS